MNAWVESTPPPKHKPFSMASLLSPPETQRHDSFTSSLNSAMAADDSAASGVAAHAIAASERVAEATGRIPLSPPISPDTVVDKEKSSVDANEDVKDPQLYAPSDTGESLSSSIPLFPSDTTEYDVDSVIHQHIASKSRPSPSPTIDEYRTVLEFQSNVMSLYNKNPRAYYERERALWSIYGSQKKQQPKKATPKAPLKRIIAAPTFKKPRQPAVSRAPRMPRQIAQPFFRDPFAYVREYTPPTPKAPRAPTNRDDVDFQSLPDHSPPLSTLPDNNNRVLKTDWKGQMLDLSNDPDRHLLHPAELNLAATLRLSCATYLCSKRRIFAARLEKLRVGKEFRKTDSQQACKIDVNKASKLWTAFDRVGWFNPEHFTKYL